MIEDAVHPNDTNYTGRFAPSPTGPLHAGSLVAAVASFLDARAHGGRCLLRIDDIDPPRAVAGATQSIQSALRAHGLTFDGEVDFQSTHQQHYDSALEQLLADGHLFACSCTRTTLGAGGTCIRDCQHRTTAPATPASLRVHVAVDTVIEFEDLLLGQQAYALGKHCPNFIVRRKDNLYAYQLACAIDDGSSAISHVIRGRDLIDSTPRQIFLQQLLGLAPPCYGHLPLIYGADGIKLSKQTGATALNNATPAANLKAALAVLGHGENVDQHAAPAVILEQAVISWRRDRIPK